MNRIRPDVDIIHDILQAVLEAQPLSSFTASLLLQYRERGGLSKKQLEGLYNKASKVEGIPPQKLATLEAIILKKPTRFKSVLPQPEPVFSRDPAVAVLLDGILSRYPSHKRVLFLQSKYNNNETLNAAELAELQRFSKLLG